MADEEKKDDEDKKDDNSGGDDKKKDDKDKNKNTKGDNKLDVNGTGVPFLTQYDPRWANKPYPYVGGGSNIIMQSGCGPVAFTMIARWYGHDVFPDKVAEWGGPKYHLKGQGTSGDFYAAAASNWSFTIESGDKSAALKALMKGYPVICGQDPGIFTHNSHMIVLAKMVNGRIIVNDPNQGGVNKYPPNHAFEQKDVFDTAGSFYIPTTDHTGIKPCMDGNSKGDDSGGNNPGSNGGSNNGGFRVEPAGSDVLIIKLPENKCYAEPIYPDYVTVSDTVPKWVLDEVDKKNNKEAEEKAKKENGKKTIIKDGESTNPQGPNGIHISNNDIDYLMKNNKGMTREQAIEQLKKDKKYTQKVVKNDDGTFTPADEVESDSKDKNSTNKNKNNNTSSNNSSSSSNNSSNSNSSNNNSSSKKATRKMAMRISGLRSNSLLNNAVSKLTGNNDGVNFSNSNSYTPASTSDANSKASSKQMEKDQKILSAESNTEYYFKKQQKVADTLSRKLKADTNLSKLDPKSRAWSDYVNKNYSKEITVLQDNSTKLAYYQNAVKNLGGETAFANALGRKYNIDAANIMKNPQSLLQSSIAQKFPALNGLVSNATNIKAMADSIKGLTNIANLNGYLTSLKSLGNINDIFNSLKAGNLNQMLSTLPGLGGLFGKDDVNKYVNKPSLPIKY